jgi:hypothetical protein
MIYNNENNCLSDHPQQMTNERQFSIMRTNMEQTIVIPDESVEIYDVVEEINHEHELFIDSMRGGIEHAVRIGDLLNKQKEKVPHGEWEIWVQMNCSFGVKQSVRYMKIASKASSRSVFENATSIHEAIRLISAADPKPKPAELPEPEKENTYFSWFDDERVTETYDNIKKMVAAVSLLKTSKEDRGAAEQILKQWDTALNKVIDKIRE